MLMNAQENVLPIEGSSRVIARQDGKLGSILVQLGRLDAGDIERVLELQRTEGARFGEAALRLGLITADDLRWAVAKQYDFPHMLPGNERISSELVVAYEPFHPRAEELRALRTQLLIRWSSPAAPIAARWCRFRNLGRFRSCRRVRARPIHRSCCCARRSRLCWRNYGPSSTSSSSIRRRRSSTRTRRAWPSARAA